jgi:hypothetical protein
MFGHGLRDLKRDWSDSGKADEEDQDSEDDLSEMGTPDKSKEWGHDYNSDQDELAVMPGHDNDDEGRLRRTARRARTNRGNNDFMWYDEDSDKSDEADHDTNADKDDEEDQYIEDDLSETGTPDESKESDHDYNSDQEDEDGDNDTREDAKTRENKTARTMIPSRIWTRVQECG